MTTVIANLESIKDWLKNGVCSRIELKKPNDEHVDSSYPYTLVHPDVHLMYVPTKDLKAIPNFVVPSICVQFDERSDRLTDGEGIMHIILNFATWDPGIHAGESFQRNADGWRDVWNFVEATLQDLENTEYIDNIRIMKEKEIKAGPITEQGAIIDFYPYWFAQVSFFIWFRVASTKKKYKDLL